MRTLDPDERRRDEDDPWARLRENAIPITSMLVTGIWLGALLADFSWWLPALIVGYAAVIPVVAILFGDHDEGSGEYATRTEPATDDSDSGARDALETLRERYAAGELTDEQFERKLERLLGTETLEDAQDRVRDRRDERRERDRTGDRNRDVEYES